MAILETTPPAKANGKLAWLYEIAEQTFGSVPNNVQLLGVSPFILQNQMQFSQYFFNHPVLSGQLLAMIRLQVALSTETDYCVHLNTGILMQEGFTRDQVEAAKSDPRQAELDDKEKALLLFVLKATKAPHSVTTEEVQELRQMGWSYMNILDAVCHGARSIAANIIYDTFKLEKD
jgi:alkylhydroperoxidase family enzyme